MLLQAAQTIQSAVPAIQHAAQAAPRAPEPASITVTLAVIGLVLSAGSAIVSLSTAWFTLWKRGKVRMTQPLMVGFTARGTDGPKVVLRSTLFSSARQGNVIASLFIRVQHGETKQVLHLWGFGDPRPTFGAGLYVGQEGKAHTHHFLPSKDKPFQFFPGETTIKLCARVVNEDTEVTLFTEKFNLSADEADAANSIDAAVVYNWGPESGRYQGGVEFNTQGFSAVQGPEQLCVELIPSQFPALLIERDGTQKLHYLIRLKNCGLVPVTPRELRLTFKAYGNGGFEFLKEGIVVHAEFRELVTGADQPLEYPITVDKVYDKACPPAVQLSISGHVMAESPAWDGSKRQGVDWRSWGPVVDNRPGPRPDAPA